MTITDWTTIIATLADPTRLQLLKVLTEGPAGVNDLAERVGLSQYNASRHLTVLRRARLVEVERRGTSRIQSLSKAHNLSADGALDLGFCLLRMDQLKLKRRK